jgi:beta-glucosidase
MVSFTITRNKLAYYNREMKRVAEPGVYEIMVGRNSEEAEKTTIVMSVKSDEWIEAKV